MAEPGQLAACVGRETGFEIREYPVPDRAPGAALINEGRFGVMVATRGDGTEAVALADVVDKRKTVPLDHPWIQTARDREAPTTFTSKPAAFRASRSAAMMSG